MLTNYKEANVLCSFLVQKRFCTTLVQANDLIKSNLILVSRAGGLRFNPGTLYVKSVPLFPMDSVIQIDNTGVVKREVIVLGDSE
jgi:hypothetical protein